jgi:hypothetical protein
MMVIKADPDIGEPVSHYDKGGDQPFIRDTTGTPVAA